MKWIGSAARAAAAMTLASSLAACATVTRGTDEAWTIKTDPGGAQVRTTAGYGCDQTPCTFRIRRKSEFDVTVTKAGYKTEHAHVKHDLAEAGAAGFLGNALIGGVIGAGVDVATGATQELKPNPLSIKLEREAVETSVAAPKPLAEAAPPPAPAD